MPSSVLLAAVASVAMATVINMMASATVYTSSMKIQRMFLEEGNLLKTLKLFLDQEENILESLSNVYLSRMEQFRDAKPHKELRHPNQVYHTITEFSNLYGATLRDHFASFKSSVDKANLAFIADENDVRGTIRALIYLQRVYNLNVTDMVNGDYLGVQGPALDIFDVFKIGELAFEDGHVIESIDWLNKALVLYSSEDLPDIYDNVLVTIKALLGRAHLLTGDRHRAQELISELEPLESAKGHNDVRELQRELAKKKPLPPLPPPTEHYQNFSRLCKLKKEQYSPKPLSPLAVCRYKEAVLPYYRFQEEILSVSPFVSLFYNVISDAEGDHIKDFVKDKLARSKTRIQNSRSGTNAGQRATITDDESTVVASISRRIGSISGLDTSQALPQGTWSSEGFKVVNFGIGGHREVRSEIKESDFSSSTKKKMTGSGERIATFQIFLGDVEIGSSTVFTQAEISVSPVKNAALMWFNFNPAHKLDVQSINGECPVVIGQKWIMNKHIWTYGNTFRRRCGVGPNMTQVDIEKDMRNNYR